MKFCSQSTWPAQFRAERFPHVVSLGLFKSVYAITVPRDVADVSADKLYDQARKKARASIAAQAVQINMPAMVVMRKEASVPEIIHRTAMRLISSLRVGTTAARPAISTPIPAALAKPHSA